MKFRNFNKLLTNNYYVKLLCAHFFIFKSDFGILLFFHIFAQFSSFTSYFGILLCFSTYFVRKFSVIKVLNVTIVLIILKFFEFLPEIKLKNVQKKM